MARRQYGGQENPIGAGTGLLLGVAAALAAAGIYFLVKKPNAGKDTLTPPAEAIPNYFPGPQGTIYEVVGPYGVPLEILQV